MASCSSEVVEPQQKGNPTLQVESQFTNVHFGDLLPFEITVNDEVPLSTLTAQLYFGEEEVAKTIIRTKENGTYSGIIEVPYGQNIPDGTAALTFTLVNTTLKKATQSLDVPITRANYPYRSGHRRWLVSNGSDRSTKRIRARMPSVHRAACVYKDAG